MKGYKVEVEYDMAVTETGFTNFKIMVISESMGVLHEHSFSHESFEYGMKVIDEMKKWALQPMVILKLVAKRLSEELGFKIDVSRGLNGFATDVAERFNSDMLKESIEEIKDDWLLPAMEIELKKRGKMKIEKAPAVTGAPNVTSIATF